MKIDFEHAIKVPFTFQNKADATVVYIIAAVFSFFGFMGFSSGTSSRGSSSDEAIRNFKEQLSSIWGSLVSYEWFWPLVVVIILLVLIILAFKIFCASAVWGYIFETIKREALNENQIMPVWEGNIGRFFWKGFLSYLIRAIYFILYSILPFGIMLVAILPNINSFRNIQCANDFFNTLFSPLAIIALMLFIFCAILYAIIQPSILVNYAIKGTFFSGFDLITIVSRIFNNPFDYIIAIVIQIPIFIALIIANIILCCTCVGILLIPLANAFIYQIIVMNIFTQVLKES